MYSVACFPKVISKMASFITWLSLLLDLTLFSQVKAIYECKAGTWGAQCSNLCGQCVGGGEFCQVFDGRCMNGCASGFHGQFCKDKCAPGTFGPYCVEKCGNCAQGNTRCDVITGHCDAGCKPGYQLPFCKIPCPFQKFGRDCLQSCDCPENCACDAVTGKCSLTECDPDKVVKYRKDSSSRQCINQYALKEIIDEYAPPDVLEIPWQSMLSVLGLLCAFVAGNFLWWWFMVRQPAPPKEDVQIDRSEKPEYLAVSQEEKNTSIVLARLKRKMALAEAAAEAARRNRRGFPFSMPSFGWKKVPPSQPAADQGGKPTTATTTTTTTATPAAATAPAPAATTTMEATPSEMS